MKATSKLSEKIAGGRRVLTAACLPPHDADAGASKQLASYFPATVDSVVVADNPNKLRGSGLACATVLAGAGLEPMLSLVTRDRNRIALEGDVLGASSLGIKAFLCLTGAHQTLGAGPQALGAFDLDSTQLCQALSRMSAQGVDFEGGRLPVAPSFFVAAAAHPYLRPLDLSVLQAKKKIAAGAKLLLTDPVFDIEGFQEWMKAMRAAGLDRKVGILASVLPLTSLAQAEALRARSGSVPIAEKVIARLKSSQNVAQTGIAIVAEVAAQLKATPGVCGIHVLSDGCEAMLPKIVEEASLA
jgi:methylenetetrahydrofolate reductase (NADPH)